MSLIRADILRGVSNDKFLFLFNRYLPSSYEEMVRKVIVILDRFQIKYNLATLSHELQIINVMAERFVTKANILDKGSSVEKAVRACEGTIINYLYEKYIQHHDALAIMYYPNRK
jgi:hypothetical protein